MLFLKTTYNLQIHALILSITANYKLFYQPYTDIDLHSNG